METDGTITPLARRPRNNRSAVSNGNRLFAPETVDGRSVAARRFHDVLEQIMADLGGAEHLSEGRRQLARRAATMAMQCELMEAEAVAGRDFDIDCFGQLTDRLGRCFQRLGLERKARPVNAPLTLSEISGAHQGRAQAGGLAMSTARLCERCGAPIPASARAHKKHCSTRCRMASSRALGSVTELNCAVPESVTSVDFIEPVTLSKPVIDVPESVTEAETVTPKAGSVTEAVRPKSIPAGYKSWDDFHQTVASLRRHIAERTAKGALAATLIARAA